MKGRGLQGAGMNSFNHYAFGAVGEWMYENILGIQPDNNSPGFKRFILKPLPEGTLTWAKGSYHSISGKIEASWKKEGNQFEYRITIPANTTATVHMPGNSAEKVLIDGEKLSDYFKSTKIEYQHGYTKVVVPSGTYLLTSEL